MEYIGKIQHKKVMIKDNATGWAARYADQICDATIYEGSINPQLNTEQLEPPLPKMQSTKIENLIIL